MNRNRYIWSEKMKKLNEIIGFIGAGNMATALISGLINNGHEPSKIISSSPEKEHLEKLSGDFGVLTSMDNQKVSEESNIIILAVKPNIIETVLSEIKGTIIEKNNLVISIAAGVKIKKIESIIGSSARIIRAMPNTPASIMQGVTAISSNEKVEETDIEKAKILFGSVGKTAEIKEKELDIFTALIGSGPAYVFYLIESLLESSQNLDLSIDDKVNLIASMISGSANLAIASSDTPQDLRKNVTSPGGVTQRAIEEFEKEDFKEIIKRSMKVAEEKSIELGDK